MNAFSIPFRPATPQRMVVTLAAVDRRLTVRWCPPASAWILDVDSPSGEAIARGIPLVSGANLLEQLRHLDLGGGLIAQTDHNPEANPTFTGLGDTGHLWFVTA